MLSYYWAQNWNRVFNSVPLINSLKDASSTMSAKSLGTLPVFYAADELQNSLPHTAMLFECDRNNAGGRNSVFTNS